MIVNIKNNFDTEEKWVDMRVISVWLARDHDDPYGTRLKMFFCPNCQAPLLQYQGEMVTIVPGVTPISKSLPKIAKCHNSKCGQKYLFVDII